MPHKSRRICAQPGCGQAIPSDQTYCTLHVKENDSGRRYNRTNRDMEQQRFYESARWARIRQAFFRAHPLCEMCEAEGHITLADVVHHRNEDWTDNDEANLCGLCASHHSTLHKRHDTGASR